MKRLILLITVLLSINYVSAQDIKRPQWKDFCPAGLENAEYKEVQSFWPDGTKDTQEIYNYWAKRRVEFEAALTKCDFLTTEFRTICYKNLKLNNQYDAEFYNDIVRNKLLNNQIRKDTQRMSTPIMINIFSR